MRIYKLAALFFSLMLALSTVRAEEIPYSEENFPDMTSDYVCVFDTANTQLLYEARAEEKMYPASMTKVMTAVLAIEAFPDLDQEIMIESRMWDGLIEANASVAGFTPGETPTVRDLLYGVLLPSGADAVQALAIASDGSVEAFVEHMNRKAAEIGMYSTHFTNATGLHDPGHYSTARDITLLFEYALQSELFREIIQSRSYITPPLESHPGGLAMESTSWPLINNGEDTYDIPGFLGGKTGFTNPAGRCFVSHAEFNGMHIILVTGHSENTGHIRDAAAVYSFYEQNYLYRTLAEKGDPVRTIPIEDSFDADEIMIRIPETIAMDLPGDAEIQVIPDLPESIHAPIEAGDPLGTVTILADDQTIRTFEIRSEISARHSRFLHVKNQMLRFYRTHTALCVTALLVLAGLLLLLVIAGRAKKRRKAAQKRKKTHKKQSR